MRKEDEISFATGKSNVVKFKVVFLGDQGVGKSSVISRFIKNEFDETHNVQVRVNVAYRRHRLHLQESIHQ